MFNSMVLNKTHCLELYTWVMMAELLFSQNLYVIQLLFHDQTIVAQKELRNMVHDNMVHLYAT